MGAHLEVNHEVGWLVRHPLTEFGYLWVISQCFDRIVLISQFLLSQHGVDLAVTDTVDVDSLLTLVTSRNQMVLLNEACHFSVTDFAGEDVSQEILTGSVQWGYIAIGQELNVSINKRVQLVVMKVSPEVLVDSTDVPMNSTTYQAGPEPFHSFL